MIRFVAYIFVAIVCTLPFRGAHATAPVPASTTQIVVPSHRHQLFGVFYLAAGADPHPTAILFHGFPGYEQNLDLAQALRRDGWNVLALHYRGSWGVGGEFSFQHCVEDADAEVKFVLDPVNEQKYRIDRSRVIVIGHSMGGFMAASAAAHNPQVKAAAILSPWNIGAVHSGHWTEEDEAKDIASDNDMAPLAGTTAAKLAHEEFTHRREFNMNGLATSIAPRPVLVTTATDGLKDVDMAFAAALKAEGDSNLVIQHFDTDHSYSDRRLELIDAIKVFTTGLFSKEGSEGLQ